MPEWFSEPVSCFQTVMSKDPVTITLASWITGIINPTSEAELKRVRLVEEYRKTGDKKLKLKIPAFCPGALMKSRDASLPEDDRILHLTGWMQFDIDAQDNPDMGNADQLRDALSNITYTAFCSISTSGKGVWGLIKVKNVKDFKACFEQLKKDYQFLGIKLDPTKGGNPTDLRYYSYDPKAYVAKSLRFYDRKSEPPKRKVSGTVKAFSHKDNWEQVSAMVGEVNQQGVDIAPDYDRYMKLAFSFANEFGENGRELFHHACEPSRKYVPKEADAQYSRCLQAKSSKSTIGTFYHFYKEAMNQ